MRVILTADVDVSLEDMKNYLKSTNQWFDETDFSDTVSTYIQQQLCEYTDVKIVKAEKEE